MAEPSIPAPSAIPDLPVPSAEAGPAPSVLWIPVRPADYGFSTPLVAGIYAADLALAAAAAFGLNRLLRALRPRPKAPPPPPARNEAMERLEALGRTLDQIPLREVALESSSIVRRFADREYGIGLSSQTAEEFREVVSANPALLPGSFAADLLSYLERCDEAKFQPVADSQPLKQEIWDRGRELVRLAPLPG